MLPGVGAFADCRRGLDAVAGMVEALEEAVRRKGRPFLGICVGMQLMAERGREYEVDRGARLDRRRGRAHRAGRSEPEDSAHGLEHARRRPRRTRCSTASPLGPQGLHAYFVHSYQLEAGGSRRSGGARPTTAARSPRSSARDNIVGTQFHPEKSQRLGLALIANFLKWRP